MKFIRNIIILFALILVISCSLNKSTISNKLRYKNYKKLSFQENTEKNSEKLRSFLEAEKSNQTPINAFIKEALKAYTTRLGNDQKSITWTPHGSNLSKVNFEKDVLMIFKTLFPENSAYNQIINTGLKNESPQALKKLLFQSYLNGLYFSEAKNEILTKVLQHQQNESQMWPYPLASLVCHGGRTILIFDKKTNENKEGFEMEALKTQLFVKNDLIKPRAAASHKLVYDKSSNSLKEEKIIVEAAIDGIQSLFNIYNHHGMNFPIGGVGNFWPDGKSYVGPEGYAFTKKTDNKVNKEIFEKQHGLQHGHLYLRFHNLHRSNKFSAIMFGLESEEPGHKGMFSTGSHNALSALKNSNESTGPCGGPKWEKIEGIKKPSTYGGKAVFLKKIDLSIFDKIEAFDLELKKKVWWIILSSSNQQFIDFYNEFLSKYNQGELAGKLMSP